MSDYLREVPADALVLYLLGDQYQSRRAHQQGVDLMRRANAAGLPDPDLRRESLRIVVTSLAELTKCDEADEALGILRAAGASEVDVGSAADRVARCRFAAARKGNAAASR